MYVCTARGIVRAGFSKPWPPSAGSSYLEAAVFIPCSAHTPEKYMLTDIPTACCGKTKEQRRRPALRGICVAGNVLLTGAQRPSTSGTTRRGHDQDTEVQPQGTARPTAESVPGIFVPSGTAKESRVTPDVLTGRTSSGGLVRMAAEGRLPSFCFTVSGPVLRRLTRGTGGAGLFR